MTRAPQHRLDRDHIVSAALALVDAEGPDGLTMRRLGERLGVDPMAVYHHLPNKAAVLDSIVERLWHGVVVAPARDGEAWPEVLHQVFTAFRARLLQHPQAATIIGSRPSITPALLRLIDDTLGRLAAAGLEPGAAMQLIDCLSAFTIGKVLAEISDQVDHATGGVAAALATVTPTTHPHLVGATLNGYVLQPDTEFDRGLRALIAGWPLGDGPDLTSDDTNDDKEPS